MKEYKLHIVFGLIFIFAGFFVSSSDLISFLRTSPTEIPEELLLGAKLFKVCLVIIGALALIFRKKTIRKSDLTKDKNADEPHSMLVSTLLIIILFIAFALRIYGLNEGLWFDEILTLENYAKAPFGEIVTTYDSQNQHFLYSILAHISFLLFGQSAWSLRLPAVLFGVGSIWALYLLARQVTSTREALLSAALCAFSYHHIWFSQNARGYIGLLFFTLISSWLFVRGLNEKHPRLWLFYAIVVALGAYTHISMVFIVMGHFVIYVFSFIFRENKSRRVRWIPIMGFCFAALLTLQLYSLVLPQMFGETIGHGGTVAVWKNPLWTLFEIVRGTKIGFRGVVPAICAIGVLGLGVWDFSRKNPIVIGLFFIPLIIVAAVTIIMGHHLWPRLFFFSLGFGILIVARGSMELGRLVTHLLKMGTKRSMILGTAVFSVIILVFAITAPRAYGPKQDYLSALKFVESNKKLNDIVLTFGSTSFVYERYYGLDWTMVGDLESFNSIRTNRNTAWIVYTFPAYLEAEYPEIMDTVRRDFRMVRQFDGTLNGGTIFVCRSEVASS
jgi:mannosyltransferase